MIRLGEWNELRIVKKVDFGVYLAEKENAKEEDRILLPRGSVRLPSGKGGGNENRDPGDAFETLREGPLPRDMVTAFEEAWRLTQADSPEYFTLYKGPGSVGGQTKT